MTNAEKFNKIISDLLKVEVRGIKDSLTQKEVPEWDSMNYLLLISELEKQFSVSFDMDSVLNAKCIGDFKKMLRSKGVKL